MNCKGLTRLSAEDRPLVLRNCTTLTYGTDGGGCINGICLNKYDLGGLDVLDLARRVDYLVPSAPADFVRNRMLFTFAELGNAASLAAMDEVQTKIDEWQLAAIAATAVDGPIGGVAVGFLHHWPLVKDFYAALGRFDGTMSMV